MRIDFQTLATELIATEAAEYHRLVAKLNLLPSHYASLLEMFLKELDNESTLSNLEKERRLAELFAHSQMPPNLMRDIAFSATSIQSPILRNAIARLLPAELRPLIFARHSFSKSDLELFGGNTENHVKKAKPITTTETRVELTSEAADVVFVSLDEDPASLKLLQSRKFTSLRYSTMTELESAFAANDDICAVVIEDSFLSTISAAAQRELLHKVASYSTFIWIKISEMSLRLERDEVFEIIRNARCTSIEPSVRHIYMADHAGVQERDLVSIETCRDSLARDKSGSLFVPGELNDDELRLLIAALTDFVRRKRFRLKASITSITTNFIQSGRPDDAKVAIVRVNELRIPIVVKLASGNFREIIKDEARRFYTFIQSGDKDLTPEVHIHGKSALMIFGLIESGEDDQEPAPTLDEVLKKFWSSEMYGSEVKEQQEYIFRAFKRALRKISNLNKLQCQERGFECKANPYLEELKKMESRGFNWGFGKEALEKRHQSEDLIKVASHKAVAQGDLHSRNILLRGENGFLIDYAYSGPGHPCTDLVRLELSLFFNYFTPFVSEEVLIKFQQEFTFSRLSSPQLLAKYPEIFQSKANLLCIQMCVAVRDEIESVLRAHQLDWDHYYAIKRLASWQALQVPPLQRFLVRTIIAAI